MLLSIIAIVALFTLANITYQLSSDNRNQGLDNLRNAVARQLATVTIRQELEKQQKEILVLDALRDSGEEALSKQEIGGALENIEVLGESIDSLQRYLHEDTSAAYQNLQTAYTSLRELWRRFFQTIDSERARSTLRMEAEYNSMLRDLNDFEALAIQSAEKQAVAQQKAVRFTDRITLSFYLFTVTLTIALGYQLIRFTNRSLTELNVGTIRVGSGDLDYHIPVKNDDEIGELAMAFNEMADRLRNAMAQVHQSKEKADQANRAKTNFLANMSHELRTPLNAIIGYSEMIIEDYRDNKTLDQEQAVDDLQRILSSGRHLLQLINDVLDLAKIESGNMTVFNETFDSVAIVEDLLTTMEPIARKNNNELILEKVDGLPPIYNDAIKFRQVLLNLLSNACKFTEQGKISVLVTYNKRSRNMIYHITDTGIGMSREQLDKVFDAFVQADSSTTKKYGGTGLGLSICKQFVELMDGSLDVTSAEGEGTTFTIILPSKQALPSHNDAIPTKNQQELVLDSDPKSDAEDADQDAPTCLGRVLIIDDDAEARSLVKRYLTREGYRHLEADNARQGIELAVTEQPDMILLDLMMPEFDGWTALSVLKENPLTRHIPVVLQSKLDEKLSGLDLGAADYLPKPVDRQRMATVLRQLNPQDRRGTALLIAPESETRENLLKELTDEAWQCLVATTRTQAQQRLAQKQPDIVLLGLGLEIDTVYEIVDTLRTAVDGTEANAPPVYVISESALASSDSRRLDLAANQLLVFNRTANAPINEALAQAATEPARELPSTDTQ